MRGRKRERKRKEKSRSQTNCWFCYFNRINLIFSKCWTDGTRFWISIFQIFLFWTQKQKKEKKKLYFFMQICFWKKRKKKRKKKKQKKNWILLIRWQNHLFCHLIMTFHLVQLVALCNLFVSKISSK